MKKAKEMYNCKTWELFLGLVRGCVLFLTL